jgi:hypothetical protein
LPAALIIRVDATRESGSAMTDDDETLHDTGTCAIDAEDPRRLQLVWYARIYEEVLVEAVSPTVYRLLRSRGLGLRRVYREVFRPSFW